MGTIKRRMRCPMLNRMAKQRLRSTLLIGSALLALVLGTGIGTGLAVAQPGSAFQDQGIRDDEGLPPRYGRGDTGLRARYAWSRQGAWAYQRGGRGYRHEMRRTLRHR